MRTLRDLAEVSVGPTRFGLMRPWMSIGDPSQARVFIVGANAATPFPPEVVDRDSYIDALVNGGDALRRIYLRVRQDRPSPTRQNIDGLVARLERHGAAPVLETNVWSLPTRSLAELRRVDVSQVAASAVLPALVSFLRPRVLIVHGVEASRGLAGSLGRDIDPASPSGPPRLTEGEPTIWVLPSLSPPAANRWLPSSAGILDAVAISPVVSTRDGTVTTAGSPLQPLLRDPRGGPELDSRFG